MQSKFIKKEICYEGNQLAPHWIYKNYNILGDCIVSFVGGCDVKISEMVDLEDVLANDFIYSPKMLHFIVEHFNIPLVEGILRQRLLINIARDEIMKNLPSNNIITRSGDDLYFNEGKLSVSIATKSITSVLIHLGINIDSNNAPVKASDLETDMGLKNIEQIANNIINNYLLEHKQIIEASCKVRGVI